jgi:aspartate 1-decarboxylase
VVINGAAAQLVHEGDLVIILAYGTVAEEEARSVRPQRVYVGEGNRIVRIAHEPAVPEAAIAPACR